MAADLPAVTAPQGAAPHVRTPLMLALVTSLHLLAGIATLLLLLAAVGVGQHSDAYIAAQAVPTVLTAVLAVSLQSVWQARLATAGEATGAWRAAHRAAHAQALVTFGGAGLALGVTSALWVPALFAGFDTATRALVVQMTPALLLAAAFNGAGAVLTTAQRGRDRLVSAEVVALLGSLAALAAVWPLARAAGVAAVAWLMLARAVLVWLALQALVGGSVPSWRAGWRDHTMWRQLRPLLASSGVYKTAPLVDRFWSALAPAGGVTLFGLAHSGMAALATVFERSLCMPAAPRIARSIARSDLLAARGLCRRSVLAVALASAAVALTLLLARPWWDSSLAALLGMQAERAHDLWKLCGLLLGYLFVAAAGTVVVSVFYALGDTSTPARIGLVGFGVGMLAKSAGFLWLGIEGLALATSLYYLGNLLALVLALERRIGRLLAPGRPA
jgi:putative peptidoglycan lipid II flippase